MQAEGSKNLDCALITNTKLRENLTLQFRWEMFHALNRVEFSQPNVNPASSVYGTVTSQANSPRQMQLSSRVMS